MASDRLRDVPTIRIPLVGSLTNRDGNVTVQTKDQLFINCFPEVVKNGVTGKASVHLLRRRGLLRPVPETWVGSTFVGDYGACTWTGKSDGTSPSVFSFRNTSTSTVEFWSTLTGQIGGSITTVDQCNSMTETVVSGTSNLVAILENSTNALQEAWYFPEGGSWTQITDSDYPSAAGLQVVGEPVHADGYMFIMGADGRIWNGDLNSLSSWAATSFITAQSIPDGGVGLARHHDTIAAFGEFSIEFFRNAGNAIGSPLAVIKERTQRIGAKKKSAVDSCKTIHSHENDIYFLSGGGQESGDRGVYRLRDFQVQKVSTPFIDKLMDDSPILTGIAGSFRMMGMAHIMFITGAGSQHACYCPETDTWWRWTSATLGAPRAVLGKNNVSEFTAVGSTGGDSYVWKVDSTPGYVDNLVAFTMTIQTMPLDFGTNRKKFFKKLELSGDQLSASGNSAVSWSNDDWATSTSAGNVDMSVSHPMLTRLGSGRRRAFKITDANDRPLRLEAMEITYDVGSS